MKKFICIFISIMVLISVFSINAIAISQSDAIKWLESQEGAEYKNQYGAQCVCFVTAYMNWCVTGNPNSGKYPTYNAVRYPEIAGNDPDNWEVIKNYLEFIPQPGDIFVSKGLDSRYGHVGVVLSSDINNAKIIDQNGVNASDYGSPAAIHNITWTGAYSPTYYIRYKGFSKLNTISSMVSFSHDTASNVINNTDARVYTWLNKKPGQNVTNAGIYIWPASGSAPSSPIYSESFAAYNNYSTYDKVHINYTIGSGKEVNYKLSEGTKYSYKIYCKVDGKDYVTSVGSFTTKGEAPHTHSYTQGGILDAHPHYTYYKCSCGDTSIDNSQTNFGKSCASCLESVKPSKASWIKVNYDYVSGGMARTTVSWEKTTNTTHYNIYFYKYNPSTEKYDQLFREMQLLST